MHRTALLTLGLVALSLSAVEYDGVLFPARHVVLSTLAGGVVLSVPHRQGQFVKEGTVLVALDCRKDSLQLILADREVERSRIRKANEEETEVQRALKAIALEERQLKAPFSGTLVKVDAKEHEYYSSGTKVIELADLGRLVTEIHVTARERAGLQSGKLKPIVFRGNNEVAAHYYESSPLAEPGIGLFTVRIIFDNKHKWDPGTGVKVRL